MSTHELDTRLPSLGAGEVNNDPPSPAEQIAALLGSDYIEALKLVLAKSLGQEEVALLTPKEIIEKFQELMAAANGTTNEAADFEAARPTINTLSTDEVTNALPSPAEQIAALLGPKHITLMQQALIKAVGNPELIKNLSTFDLLNLFLKKAAGGDIRIPHSLWPVLKKIKAMTPMGLNNEALTTLSRKKRARLFQSILTLLSLMSFVISVGTSLMRPSSGKRGREAVPTELPTPSTELPTSTPIRDSSIPDAPAEAKVNLESYINSDLEMVINTVGWEDFLPAYADGHYESTWPAETVFNLLLLQKGRYWGQLVVMYPEIFKEVIKDRNIKLDILMSSAGAEHFFAAVEKTSMMQNGEDPGPSWFDLWTSDMLMTLKLLKPDWMAVVVEHPNLFIGLLEKEDLPALFEYFRNQPDPVMSLRDFLDHYDDTGAWDFAWSRRDLLNAIKESNIDWDFYRSDLFQQVFTRSERVDELVHDNLSLRSVAEHGTIKDLFDQEAIFYVLENYDNFANKYPVDEIMAFVRDQDQAANRSYYYTVISLYPEIFGQVDFSDDELSLLVYREKLDKMPYNFFDYYQGEDGWGNTVSMDRVVAIGRDTNPQLLEELAIQYPALILPFFNEDDLLNLLMDKGYELIKLDALNRGNPVWRKVLNPKILREWIKKEKKYFIFPSDFIDQNMYFFQDILTLEEIEQVTKRTNNVNDWLLANEKWRDVVTPSWAYSLFKPENKAENKETFALAVAENVDFLYEELTDDDKLLLLKYDPRKIVDNYSIHSRWREDFSPEFLLNFFYSGRSGENYGRIVVEHPEIFGPLIADGQSLAPALAHGGSGALFYSSLADDHKYNYENWLDIITLEELFHFMMQSPDGRAYILYQPALFGEFIHKEDLNDLVEGGSAYTLAALMEEPWNKLWSYEEIYQAAKTAKVEGLAHFIIPEYYNQFWPYVDKADLDVLISSYQMATDLADDLELLTKDGNWTTAEILESLKKEKPESWGAYVAVNFDYFASFFYKEDLQSLIEHGAMPAGLTEFGLWTSTELFDAYVKYQPESWGAVVISYPDVFKDEVVRRGITLGQLLDNGGLGVANSGSLLKWDEVWSLDEWLDALDKRGTNFTSLDMLNPDG